MRTYEQLETERFVRVNYDLLDGKNLEMFGEESLLVFGLIQQNLLMRGQCIFNLQYIYDKLGIAKTNSRKQKQIKDTVAKLQVGKVITCEVDLSKINNTELVKVDLAISDDEFAIIYDYELEAIISCVKENVFNLFNLTTLIKYRSGVKKYCYWNQDSMAKEIGVKSRKTIASAINVLENDIKLIKTHNVGSKKLKDGSVRQSNHMYAMNYEGASELLIAKGVEYANILKEDGIKLTNHANANEKRSLSAKINHLVRKYEEGTMNKDEEKALLSLETEYYNMIKDDEATLDIKKDEFVLLDIDKVIEEPTPIAKKKTKGFAMSANEIAEKKATRVRETHVESVESSIDKVSTVDNIGSIENDISEIGIAKFYESDNTYTIEELREIVKTEISKITMSEIKDGTRDMAETLTIIVNDRKKEIVVDKKDDKPINVFEQSEDELRRNRAKRDEPDTADSVYDIENEYTGDWQSRLA